MKAEEGIWTAKAHADYAAGLLRILVNDEPHSSTGAVVARAAALRAAELLQRELADALSELRSESAPPEGAAP